MISVLSLVGRLNVARCCTAPGAALHITVPVIVRRLLGRSIGRSVRKRRSEMPNSSKRGGSGEFDDRNEGGSRHVG